MHFSGPRNRRSRVNHLVLGVFAVTFAGTTVLAPSASADSCEPGPDLTDCFCSDSIPEIPTVYFGRIEAMEDGPFLEFYFVVESSVSGDDVEPDLAVGDRTYLKDVPSHSEGDQFLLYFYPSVFADTPVLLGVPSEGFAVAVPPGFLLIRESFCRTHASADDVAAALVSPQCRNSIRASADLPPRSTCSTQGCAGALGSDPCSTTLALAAALTLLMTGHALRQRRDAARTSR